MREQEVKVKETEAITIKNSEEEDKLENKISRFREEFKLSLLIQIKPLCELHLRLSLAKNEYFILNQYKACRHPC